MLMVRRSKGFWHYFVDTDDRSVTSGIHSITGYTDLSSPCFWYRLTVLSGLCRCGRCLFVSLSYERHNGSCIFGLFQRRHPEPASLSTHREGFTSELLSGESVHFRRAS